MALDWEEVVTAAVDPVGAVAVVMVAEAERAER